MPWAAPGLADAGTVHVGGTRDEMAEAENLVAAGRHPERPYVLLSQPSRFDAGRAPDGRHILWSYCHVPAGSDVDMAEAVMAQLERFAPGFRDLVVRYQVTTAAGLAEYNENYVGGDYAAGLMDLRGLLRRPVLSRVPWRTPLPGRVPVFVLDAARPRGDRHARLPRRNICPQGHIRPARSRAGDLGLRAAVAALLPVARLQPASGGGPGKPWIPVAPGRGSRSNRAGTSRQARFGPIPHGSSWAEP